MDRWSYFWNKIILNVECSPESKYVGLEEKFSRSISQKLPMMRFPKKYNLQMSQKKP